jgi:hypothetical protein
MTAGIVCSLLAFLGYSQTVSSGFQFANGLFLESPGLQKTMSFMVRCLVRFHRFYYSFYPRSRELLPWPL